MVRYGAITGSLGNIGDRYCLRGYKQEVSFTDKLKAFSQIPYLKGVEISHDEVSQLSEAFVRDEIANNGLEISAVGLDLTSDPVWQFGSITAKEEKIRREATEKIKRTIDFSAGIGSNLVNIWLGQDGFDYPFQVDYADQWTFAAKALQECADYNKDILLAIEPKPREPRNRSYIDSTSTGLLLVNEIGRENFGLTIDVGHVIQEGKNMAQSVVYSHLHGKLFNLHVNDNYCGWDDDMIVGSVRTVEFIELFYYLRKINYDKWCSVDIFPYREKSMRALEESIQYMRKFDEMVDLIGKKQLDNCLIHNDVTESIRLIREKIYR